MTTASWVFAACALVFAVGDWCFVLTGRTRARYVTKPAALAALVGVAASVDPAVSPAIRTAFVVALVLSLAGDVFLMLPDRFFTFGLAAFLLAHIAYIVGLQTAPTTVTGTLLGLAIVVATVLVVGRHFLPAIRSGENRKEIVPGLVYVAAISTMVVSAYGTLALWAIVGGTLFYCSDAILAWNRFVGARRWGPLAVMVTYHLGQAGLVVWLLRP